MVSEAGASASVSVGVVSGVVASIGVVSGVVASVGVVSGVVSVGVVSGVVASVGVVSGDVASAGVSSAGFYVCCYNVSNPVQPCQCRYTDGSGHKRHSFPPAC